MKTEASEEEEFQILPTIAPCVNLSITNARAVWDGDFDGFFLAQMAACEDFDFFTERHTVVGGSHFFVFKDGLSEHPHAGLRVFDAVPEQHPSGEREHPVSKAMKA